MVLPCWKIKRPSHEISSCSNAGAAIYVAGLANDLWGGVAKAREAIGPGAAKAKLNALVAATQQYAKHQ